jgi:hypothetical protein
MSDDSAVRGGASGQLTIENIEQTDQFRRLGVREPSKAATARSLALILTWTFTGLLVISVVVGLIILWRSPTIDDKTLAASSEFLKVTSSIFSPLLAFVLGYYFSKREE